MEKDFLKVSLRQNAIFVPDETESKTDISDQTLHFVAQLRSIGFGVSEPLLRTIIKGLVARDVYSDPGAYTMVLSHRNRELKAARDILGDRRRYNEILSR